MSPDLFGHDPPTALPPDGDKGREERGAFYTPDALALAICRSLKGLGIDPTEIFEPGCGGGAFLRASAATWPVHDRLWGVDLVPACSGPGQVTTTDLFTVAFRYGVGLVIGNPDFAIAERVVRHCFRLLARGGYLAFLLRLGFLASQKRSAFFREHPLWALQPIGARPSFTGGDTDQYDYALFVWRQGHRGEGRLLPPLEWR